jgi:carbohydrate-selective porin OprB
LTTGIGTISFLRNAYGFEAYYNVAITHRLQLTPDIQIIRPGEKQFTDTSSGVPVKKNIDTTTVFGIRLKMVF